jgi:hypothetical protein
LGVGPYRCRSNPHAPSDVLLLRTDGVGVNSGRAELGVTEPPLHQVERDAGGDDGYPKPCRNRTSPCLDQPTVANYREFPFKGAPWPPVRGVRQHPNPLAYDLNRWSGNPYMPMPDLLRLLAGYPRFDNNRSQIGVMFIIRAYQSEQLGPGRLNLAGAHVADLGEFG